MFILLVLKCANFDVYGAPMRQHFEHMVFIRIDEPMFSFLHSSIVAFTINVWVYFAMLRSLYDARVIQT